jgi:hypothetical protein
MRSIVDCLSAIKVVPSRPHHSDHSRYVFMPILHRYIVYFYQQFRLNSRFNFTSLPTTGCDSGKWKEKVLIRDQCFRDDIDNANVMIVHQQQSG